MTLAADRKPETLGQARRWETIKRRYIGAGLCDKCAAQAAWGHQIGFTRSNAPCADCAAVVGAFPKGTSHATWKALERDSDARVSDSLTESAGTNDACIESPTEHLYAVTSAA